MRLSYVVALTTVAVLTILAQLVVQSALVAGEADARLINRSGRQRMLSQRIAKCAAVLDEHRSRKVEVELDDAIEEFTGAHRALREHERASDAPVEALAELDPFVARLVESARTVRDGDVDAVPRVLEAEAEFLPRMHRVVGLFQRRADVRVADLRRLQLLLGSLTLLALVLIAIYVFEPLRTQIGSSMDQLRDAREKAVASVRAKDDFLATMSHEIRTPLNGVIGMNELILATDLDEEQRDLATTGGRSAQNLLTLLNEVLDYAKMAGGNVDLEKVPFSLHDLVDDVVVPVAGQLDPREVELVVDAPPDLPGHALGDPTRLRQILGNLAGNAAKFTERGHVMIRLRVDDPLAPERLIVEVADTGIGIPADRIATIFERFTQADSSTTRRFGGTGLGLAISRDLCEMMGGSVEIESELGEGTTFRVEIPLEFIGDQGAIADVGAGDGPVKGLAGARFAVVDDHPVNRTIVERLLDRWGAAVESFADAGELLERLERGGAPFDGLLLDHHLPDVSGVELARRLVADGCSVPMVLLSSMGFTRHARLGEDDPFTVRIIKPVLPVSLARALRVLVGADEETSAAPDVRDAGVVEPLEGLRLLVAEDNPVNQRIVAAHLRSFGCEYEIVGNGREAVDRVREAAFDVVLLDVQMPVLDGHAAARELRADPRFAGLPIVALTAGAGAHDEAQSLAAGMNAHLSKPFRRDDLCEVVERVRSGAVASERRKRA